MRFVLFFAVAAVVAPQLVSAAALVVEATGTSNPYVVQLPANSSVTARVSYRGEFPVTGAEFRLAGVPQGWLVSAIPNPAANIVIGSPVDDTGVNISFSTCNDQVNSYGLVDVWLFDLNIIAMTLVNEVSIYPEARNPPLNASFDCGLAVSCAANGYQPECVGTAGICINPVGGCGVPVEAPTWSVVKSLFR